MPDPREARGIEAETAQVTDCGYVVEPVRSPMQTGLESGIGYGRGTSRQILGSRTLPRC